MRLVRGDLIALSESVEVLAFTANGCLKGFPPRLVMGAGAARAVRDNFEGVDLALGEAVGFGVGLAPDYHLVSNEVEPGRWVAAVQVKRHWRDSGDIRLCAESLRKFAEWLGDRSAVLNMPLVGLGGYAGREDEVMAVVDSALGHLNVTVCHI